VTRASALLLLLGACSSGSSSGGGGGGGRCDAKAEEIRVAAEKRGLDAGAGVCDDTTPAVQKDFAAACADLKACTGN
jgi:hypothetical protein